jgi:uncharacterized protein YcbK (DUF882 family)
MNMFSIIWMKFVSMFRAAKLRPLDPVVVTITEDGEVVGLSDEAVEVLVGQDAKVKRPKRQLTKNFHIDEFACHDGTAVPSKFYVNVLELAENLQALRDQIGKPIKIMSGYRHLEYNKKIGGARKSQHLTAMAADIKVKGIGPAKLAVIVEKAIVAGVMEKGGVGRYPTFTHYDIRGKNARWGGTRKKG